MKLKLFAMLILALATVAHAQDVPKTWNEAAMKSGILNPPIAGVTVTRVTPEYYYRMRERVVFRPYPVYGSKFEPKGYLEKLALVEPEVIFDAARLKTESDWILAGQEVFRAPNLLFPIELLPHMRGILERTGVPVTADGTYPHLTIVVPKKGKPMLGMFSCAMGIHACRPTAQRSKAAPELCPTCSSVFPRLCRPRGPSSAPYSTCHGSTKILLTRCRP